MRYAQIRKMDISNGEGIGVSLFVQGCHFHCKNCFNKETWDFDGGKEWTEEVEKKFLELINKPYITRVTIIGGEPLASENVIQVLSLMRKIREIYPQKKIWLYTGYTVEILEYALSYGTPRVRERENFIDEFDISILDDVRNFTLVNCDVVVDGLYKDELRDLNLKYRGSSNQRIIDINKSIENKKITEWR